MHRLLERGQGSGLMMIDCQVVLFGVVTEDPSLLRHKQPRRHQDDSDRNRHQCRGLGPEIVTIDQVPRRYGIDADTGEVHTEDDDRTTLEPPNRGS